MARAEHIDGVRVAPVVLRNGQTRWRCKLDIGRDPISGRRRRPTLTTRTLGEMRTAIRAARSKHDELSAGTVTLRAYLEQTWLPHTAKRGIREVTYANYASDVRLHIAPALGHVTLAKLDTIRVQQWVNGQPGAPGTIRLRFGTLRMALQQAVRWRLLSRNPCDGVVTPKVGPTPRTVLDPGQQARLLGASGERPYYAVWCLLVRCGLRIGEALALSWADVDLDANVLHVRRTLTQDARNREIVGETTKTGASRPVLLDPETAAAIAGLPKRALWLFPHATDPSRPVWRGTVGAALKADCIRAGVPVVKPHDLRYAHATDMARAGVHPTIAMARLGHTSMQMMARYVRPTVEDQAAVLDRLGSKDGATNLKSGGNMRK